MTKFNYISLNIKRFQKETKDGFYSCSILRHWEIYARYDAFKKMGNSETMARFNTSEQFKIHESNICRIIKKMESNVSTVDKLQ